LIHCFVITNKYILYRMCNNCFNTIEEIEDTVNAIDETLQNTTCLCCRHFYTFVKATYLDFKIICHLKIRKHEQVSPNALRSLNRLERRTRRKVEDRLLHAMEILDNKKNEFIAENTYLIKENELKKLYDYLCYLDEAYNR